MKRLKVPYECGCGEIQDRIPENFKPGKEDLPGYWWDCVCRSSHYTPPDMVDPIEYCDCDDCADRERPCALDCGDEDPCRGCREARQEAEETAWEIDQAQGRR